MERKGEVIIYQTEDGKNEIEVQFQELHQTVEFLKSTLGTKELSGNEAHGLLEIISNYTRSFVYSTSLIALLVAQSDPVNKDLMIKLVINLTNE